MGNNNSRLPASADNDHTFSRALGSGGFGTVCAVRRKVDGKLIARKDIYYGKYMGIWRDVRKFDAGLEEVMVMSSIKHENIVRIFDYNVFENERTLSIYMELCDGSLHGMMTEHSSTNVLLSPQFVHHAALSILNGLEYLHSKSIVHRDIKPENILIKRTRISSHPVVKISDFGISVVQGGEIPVIGTQAYMAPEVVKAGVSGHPILPTYASDMWSFGCVLAAMHEKTKRSSYYGQEWWIYGIPRLVRNCKEVNPDNRITVKAARHHLERNGPSGFGVKLRKFLIYSACFAVTGRIGWAIYTAPDGWRDVWRMFWTRAGARWFIGDMIATIICAQSTGKSISEAAQGSWFFTAVYLTSTYYLSRLIKFNVY